MQPATPLGGRRRNSRRTVILGVVVLLAIAVGLFLILRGSGSSKNASKPTAVPGTARHGTVVPTTEAATTATHVVVKKKHTPVHLYATAVLPYLKKGSRLFDQVARATAAAGSPSQLGDICIVYEPRVEASKTEFDGVPH